MDAVNCGSFRSLPINPFHYLARAGSLYGLLSRSMRRAAGGIVVRPLRPESNFTVVTERDDGSGV